jgi:hypothetical protein
VSTCHGTPRRTVRKASLLMDANTKNVRRVTAAALSR